MATHTTSSDGGSTDPVVRLSPAVSDLLAERSGELPVWVRAPKRGLEHYSSLSRAKLYQLDAQGKIKSASLREPGRVRGCRLFLLSSILEYIAANLDTR